MTGPYHGLQVVDLASAMPGSYASTILAELGADVIKVEPPEGNALRGQAAFHVFNRSKSSVVIDLATQSGRQSALGRIASADIVITDYTSAEAEALGLAYTVAAERNPRLIYCEMPPMGSGGPLADTPRHDDLVMAHSGLMSAQWATREGPVYQVLPMASYGAAFLAVGAIGAALCVRERTGSGQQVEVSWLAGAVAISMMHIVTPENEQVSPWDRDPQGGMGPAYRLYECGDGKWLDVACGHATFFNRFCLAMDRPELVGDPRFENAPWMIDREHRPFLKRTFGEIFKTRPRDEWLRVLREWDVPCAPVMSRAEAIDDPQVVHNGMRVEIEDPELGRTIQCAPPLRMSLTQPAIKGPAPRLGEQGNVTQAEGTTVAGSTGGGAAPEMPLKGLRVLDLATYVAGAMVAKVLADLGADVVKIEPLDGDPMRSVAYSFASVNRGKRSIALNLATAEGRELVYELVKGTDIVAANFRPGIAERLGVDYEKLRGINPRIIAYSGTAWGASGPYAALPGYDPLVSARTGLMHAQGGDGHPPVYNYIGCYDHGTALTGLYGVLAALYHRERTGLGQLVETSILSVGLALQGAHFIFYDGRPADPEGGPDLLGVSALRRLYRASDGWLMLVADDAERWGRLVGATGRADLADRYATTQALAEPREGKLARELEEFLATRTRDEWLSALREHKVPAARALTVAEIYKDAQYVANRFFVLEEQPPWGKLWVTASLAKFSACPGVIHRPSPRKGEHTDEILRGLGVSAERVAELREGRIVV